MSFTIKNIAGRGWLKAYALTRIIYVTIHRSAIIATYFLKEYNLQIIQWLQLIAFISAFSLTCLMMFLFANWSKKRMDVDSRNLLFSYKGRIPRAAFWIAIVSVFPVIISTHTASLLLSEEGAVKIVLWIIYAILIIPSIYIYLAIYTKRWHDLGKSGWMSLVSLIPVIGALYLIWQLGFTKGTDGDNRFGPDPLGQASEYNETLKCSDDSVSYVCSDCGAEVSIDDNTCPKCGSDISEIEDDEDEV